MVSRRKWPLRLRLAHMVLQPPIPSQRPRRRTPSAWRRPVGAYAKAVGELLWTANRAQASFADLFAVLVDPNQLDAGLAIWFSMQTDSAQVKALEALLRVRTTPTTRLWRSAHWAVAAAKKLAEIRNDAAHMATAPTTHSRGVAFIPNPIGNPAARLQRRSGTDFLSLFERAKGDYIQVQQYVHDIFCHLAYPNERYPLPLRPRLLSVTVGSPHKK